jgi:phosphate starvation-inducible PhoH-like protein
VVHRVTGINFIYFTERDVVRHSLVQRIIRAYEEFDQSRAPEAKHDRGILNHEG